MFWDPTTPANDEPIRNLGEIGRDHWLAIQNADTDAAPFLNYRALQMADRTAIGVAVDPTVASGTCYIYSKQDGGGIQELYFRDAASKIIQVTNDGTLGSSDTTIGFESFTNDAGTTTYDEKNLVSYWAYIDDAGGIVAQSAPVGQALSCSRISDGVYEISFHASHQQSSADYGVVATVKHSPGNSTTAHYSGNTTALFYVRITNQNGTYANRPFTVLVLGGRPT